MIFLIVFALLILAIVLLCLFSSEEVISRATIEKWVNIPSPSGKEFCFYYAEDQAWGGEVYLAQKIIQVLEETIEVKDAKGATTKIPFKGLKQFQHPYSHIDHLEIIPASPTVEFDESTEFSVRAIDKDGKPRTLDVEKLAWTTRSKIINTLKAPQVVYQANKAGIFEINVSLGGFSATTKITVREPSQLTSLVISPQNVTLELSETQVLEIKGQDQYGQKVAVESIQWLRSALVSKMSKTTPIPCGEASDQFLVFLADTPGKFSIIARSVDIEAKATVTVKEPAKLAILNISPSRLNLITGEMLHFTVEGKDQYGRWINTETVSWRASSGLIDDRGDFLAEVAGEVTIIAEIEGIEATVYVTVTEPSRLASLSIEPLWAEMQVGQTQRFTAIGQDQYSKSIDTGLLKWSATIGQIDSNGIFKATAPGKCIITAKSGNVYSQVSAIVTAKTLSFPATLIESAIKDPITQEFFHAGEIVYCCIDCKLGHHEDSWEYYGRQCSRCNLDQNVNVYRLPDTLIAKASQYSSNTQIDLSSLQGQDSAGNSYTLRDAITRSTYDESSRGEENLWRFEYSEAQNLGSREVIARKVLAVLETEIQVEDCHGNIIWLPIALLLAVAVVPVAAKGAIIGGVAIWALANYFSERISPDEISDREEIINEKYIPADDIHQLCSKRSTWVTVIGKIKLTLSLPGRPPHLYFSQDICEGFYAYIRPSCVRDFPDPEALLGKTVLLSGEITVYGNQRPHIILRSSSQLQEIRKNL